MSNANEVEVLGAVVAIPVRNEQQRIEACLNALAGQLGLARNTYGILLFLNNCSDGTAAIVTGLLSNVSWPTRVIEVVDERATAGWARRCAMEAAAAWLADSGHRGGVILTSDADSQVGADWVKRNLDHIAAGADAVAGRISLTPAEAALLPDSLHARGRLEAEYEALLTEFGGRLDPEPGNPWPCHWTKSGATLAVRRSAYEAIGGMPALAYGEDRAFTDALRQAGFVVRQPNDIEVLTSGRLDGRAAGGAADTMRLRCEIPDSPCDDRLERLPRAMTRVLWRRWLRLLHGKGWLSQTWTWAPALSISKRDAIEIAHMPIFARAHGAIEEASPRLVYRPITPSRLPGQIRLARLLISGLRLRDRLLPQARPVALLPFGPDTKSPQTQPTLR